MSAPTTPKRGVAMISVSIDLGAGRRGVDMGPSALRIAGITAAVEGLGYAVKELGTVTAGGMETTERGAEGRVHFLTEIADVAERAGRLVELGLSQGHLPLVLGGDHSLSLGTVAAVARHHRERDERVGLIWTDAHADMNTPDTTPSGNIHGMSLAALLGRGHPRLAGLAGAAPALVPENVTVLGARALDDGERTLIRELGVRVITMSEIDEHGIGPCMDEALHRANVGTAGFVLSFDLDSLDPREAPGVGTPVQGGLTYREGHLVCEKAARAGTLLAMEIVELNPVLDRENHTARLAVGLVASALGRTIL
ncbi:MAG TPA: arginase [Longimicrobiales bacterium]|nr:arginase [Longimicrobiales bacterium]